MQIGVVYPQTELQGDPTAVRLIGTAVEELGFDHLLSYDHVLGAVHADRARPLPGPYSERDPFHDPFVMFAYLAGITERINFATGVLVLPQRQTALVARQAAVLICCLVAGCGLVSGSGGTTSSTRRSGRTSVPAAQGRRSRSSCCAGCSPSPSSTSRAASSGLTERHSSRSRRDPSRSGSVDRPTRRSTAPPGWRTASSSSAAVSTTRLTPGTGCAIASTTSAGRSRTSARTTWCFLRLVSTHSRGRSMPGAKREVPMFRWSQWTSDSTPRRPTSNTSPRLPRHSIDAGGRARCRFAAGA